MLWRAIYKTLRECNNLIQHLSSATVDTVDTLQGQMQEDPSKDLFSGLNHHIWLLALNPHLYFKYICLGKTSALIYMPSVLSAWVRISKAMAKEYITLLKMKINTICHHVFPGVLAFSMNGTNIHWFVKAKILRDSFFLWESVPYLLIIPTGFLIKAIPQTNYHSLTPFSWPSSLS